MGFPYLVKAEKKDDGLIEPVGNFVPYWNEATEIGSDWRLSCKFIF
jgi:hypothetical protein